METLRIIAKLTFLAAAITVLANYQFPSPLTAYCQQCSPGPKGKPCPQGLKCVNGKCVK